MTAPTILLCDHEHMLRRATALILKNHGGRVSEAATLEEALRRAHERIYDVAIFELEEGSPDAAEVLRALRDGGCVPRRLIVCSPRGSRQHADELTDLIVKPYPFQRLLSAVFGPRGQRRPTRSAVFPRSRAPRGGSRPARRASQRAQARGASVTAPRRAVRVRRGRG